MTNIFRIFYCSIEFSLLLDVDVESSTPSLCMQYALRITHSYPDLFLHVKICTGFDVKWCYEVKVYGLKSTLCHIDKAVYTVHSDQSL